MGTPETAVPYLEKLATSEFEVVAVITQPDRPAGRGRRLAPPPVKVAAEKLGLPVKQFERLDTTEVREWLEALAPDLLWVVACGLILPRWALQAPRRAALNVHYSLLPALRGAAPMHWAIIRGLKRSGVTVQHMADQLDAGDIVAQAETAIGEDETQGELCERLTKLGLGLMDVVLAQVVKGQLPRRPQPAEGVSYAPALTREDGRIDWSRPAREIHDLIRGCNPWPGAFSTLQGKRLNVWRSEVTHDFVGGGGEPGQIVEADPRRGLLVATGAGVLRLTRVQGEGRRSMTGQEFCCGARQVLGQRLGL